MVPPSGGDSDWFGGCDPGAPPDEDGNLVPPTHYKPSL